MRMTTVTIQESGAPCFSHESMLTPPPEDTLAPSATEDKRSHTRSPRRHRHSPSPGRRYNGDGKGIQVDIGARLREYVDCLNNRRWDVIGNHLADHIQCNGHPQTREEHVARLRSRAEGPAGLTVRIDTMLVDKRARAVAARFINAVTPADDDDDHGAGGETFEFDEQCFAWFDDRGKIARLVALQDNDGIRARSPAAAATPRFLTRGVPDAPIDLASLYRDYVDCINRRDMREGLSRFCAAEVRHNGRALPLDEYRQGIERSQEAVAGLRFEVRELLVDEDTQQVAARLEISGTPVAEFAGARPRGGGSGGAVRFHEHCMYRFDRGKIALVWATMELDAVRRQMEGGAERREESSAPGTS